jgi:phosphoribosylformylglycinamidine cyclo-ligase
MATTSEVSRTVGLRVVSGGGDLAARTSLDFDQRLFRRNYRSPVLISAALAADSDDIERWLTSGAAALLGRDVAARVLNRVASEAAEPLYLHAVVAGGSPRTQQEIRGGIAEACIEADCTFLTGSDANTWDRKVTIAAAATGVVERSKMMDRRRFTAGDVVLAVASDRLWPALVARAGDVLADPDSAKALARLPVDAASAVLQPPPVLAGRLQTVLRQYTVKRVVHAMIPVEGDGLTAALGRLTGGEFDVKRARGKRVWSDLLAALQKHGLKVDDIDEAHRLGIGYLIVVGEAFAGAVARRLRRLGAATYPFGRLVAAAD